MLNFRALIPTTLHQSAAKVASENKPMLCSSISNFIWIGASCHACGTTNLKCNNFGMFWGSPTYLLLVIVSHVHCLLVRVYCFIFTARCNARNARIASAVLATAIPSVCLSVHLSHAGTVSKRRHVARCSLHCQIAKCV